MSQSLSVSPAAIAGESVCALSPRDLRDHDGRADHVGRALLTRGTLGHECFLAVKPNQPQDDGECGTPHTSLPIPHGRLPGRHTKSPQFAGPPTKGISACPSGMTLFTALNKTWLNVEGTLNYWNQANCSIASAGAMTHGSIQLNGKSIGTRKRLACTRVSYANFARNTEDKPRNLSSLFNRNSLFSAIFSLIPIWKFPVPLRREFVCKLLNPRPDQIRKSRWMAGFCKIPC
jgi:hypothetical protein